MSVAKVLNKLEQGQLYKMVRQEGYKGDEDDSSKKLVETLASEIEEIGINYVSGDMKKETLDRIVKPLNLELTEKPSKQVVRKRLCTEVKDEGLDSFFGRKEFDTELLNLFYESCPTDEEAKEDKKKLGQQVAKAIAEAGLQIFFGRFDVSFLQDLMDSCNLKYNTDNKNALASALASQSPAQKEKKKGGSTSASKPKFSKSKKDIEKGITYQDIFQHYYLDELQKYCKDNDLKTSGAKKEIINRILKFLDGDVESTKVGTPGTPKRKRSSSASRSKSPSKKKTSKKSSKKGDDEKEDEKETKEEKEPKEKKSSKKKKTEEKTEEKAEDKESDEKTEEKAGKKKSTKTK